jgi:hypothetical protein
MKMDAIRTTEEIFMVNHCWTENPDYIGIDGYEVGKPETKGSYKILKKHIIWVHYPMEDYTDGN